MEAKDLINTRMYEPEIFKFRMNMVVATIADTMPDFDKLPRPLQMQIIESCDMCYTLGQTYGFNTPSKEEMDNMNAQAEQMIRFIERETN